MKNFVFDIETGPLGSDALELIMPAFDESEVKIGNIKDPDKIAEKITKARQDHVARFMRNAALSPLTGQVLAIGVADGSIGNLLIDSDEANLISLFFDQFEKSFKPGEARWLGFNIANFDIPFLVRRAWMYGIEVPRHFLSRRYPAGCFTDLLTYWNLTRYPPEHVSLGALAQYFGIGKKETNGAQFAELLRYDPKTARAYLLNDLEITWCLAERLGLIAGNSAPVNSAPVTQPEPEIEFF